MVLSLRGTKQSRAISRYPLQSCSIKGYFSKHIKDLPLVALFMQEKIYISYHKDFHYYRGYGICFYKALLLTYIRKVFKRNIRVLGNNWQHRCNNCVCISSPATLEKVGGVVF